MDAILAETADLLGETSDVESAPTHDTPPTAAEGVEENSRPLEEEEESARDPEPAQKSDAEEQPSSEQGDSGNSEKQDESKGEEDRNELDQVNLGSDSEQESSEKETNSTSNTENADTSQSSQVAQESAREEGETNSGKAPSQDDAAPALEQARALLQEDKEAHEEGTKATKATKGLDAIASSAEVLAETMSLLSNVDLGDGVSSCASSESAAPSSDPKEVADIAPTKSSQLTSSLMKTCNVSDIRLICEGKRLNLEETMLLEACTLVSIRQDVSNQTVLEACSAALKEHSFDIRSMGEGQIRASFQEEEAPAGDEPQQNSVSTTPSINSTGSSLREDNGGKQATANEGSPDLLQDAKLNAEAKLDQISAALPTWAKSGMSKAWNFSVSSVKTAIRTADPYIQETTFSEQEVSTKQYCSMALGVEVQSENRSLVISGLDQTQQHVIEDLAKRDISAGPSEPGVLDEDFVRDITAALRWKAEQDLIQSVSPQERQASLPEWRTAQVLALLKANYRIAGVPVPQMERAPPITQMPLEEYEDGAHDMDPSQDEKDTQSPVLVRALDSLKFRVRKELQLEMAARKRRKEAQLKLRAELSEKNKRTAILTLRNSQAARCTPEARKLAAWHNLTLEAVLGNVHAIFDNKPGRLWVTGTHLLFSCTMLGFKRHKCIPLSALSSSETEKVRGPASFFGDAAVICAMLDGTKSRFVVPSLLEAECIVELIRELVVMQREAQLKVPLRTNATEPLATAAAAELQDESPRKEYLTPTQESTDDTNNNDAKESAHKDEDEDEDEASGKDMFEAADSQRQTEMKKLMESTILQDDEEEF